MTVISRGTGRMDYSQGITKTVQPDIGGSSIDQGKLYFSTTIIVNASTINILTLGTTVAPNHKWEIYDVSASGDSNLLMNASIIRNVDGYAFNSRYGYGSIDMRMQKSFDITAGDTVRLLITNFDPANYHVFYFTFHGLDITLAPT